MNTDYVSEEESCSPDQPSLLQTYDCDLERLARRVGKDRAASSYTRQRQSRQSLARFLTDVLHRQDIPLTELTGQFIRDYALYLSTERQMRPGTIWMLTQMLKGVVHRACQRQLLAASPFADFHVSKNIRDREYLTERELRLLMDCRLSQPALRYTRDLFVFAALTGMSYIDIRNLRPADISTIDGEQWIQGHRQKTHTVFVTRLLPEALDIVNRYRGSGSTVFAPVNYRTLAAQMPRLMAHCGITKHITFHCARHTFAVMALNAGMPIESVSRILGHTNITTTQIYAKITMQKLSHDMKLFDQHFSRTRK
ncbi:MAG: tyrosine-type recombinase/integrase [Prevotella sp.]|nr:tyrosine-type recombinase/integrase [Prevotella sp.]